MEKKLLSFVFAGILFAGFAGSAMCMTKNASSKTLDYFDIFEKEEQVKEQGKQMGPKEQQTSV